MVLVVLTYRNDFNSVNLKCHRNQTLFKGKWGPMVPLYVSTLQRKAPILLHNVDPLMIGDLSKTKKMTEESKEGTHYWFKKYQLYVYYLGLC